MTDRTPETLHRGRHLVLVQEGHWEYVRRRSDRGAVFVAALTPARELVLVEQYRIPVHARTIELPAGILGDEAEHRDETPEACALRELEEEAGYRGADARVLIAGPVAPGLTSEVLYLVEITGVERVGSGGGVGGEDITVHTAPLDSIHDWLDARRREGRQVEPRIYAALHLIGRRAP